MPTATEKHTFSAIRIPDDPRQGRMVDGTRALGGSFLAGILLSAFFYATVIYFVNPVRDFATQSSFPAVRSDYRNEKLKLFEAFAAEGPVDALVLGSSRSMLLNGDRLRELSGGQRFFNFGLASAKAEDFLAVLRFTLGRGHRPKRVLIGVDVESLRDAPAHGDSIHPLRELAAGSPGTWERVQSAGRRIFTWSYARDAARSVYLRIRPRAAAVGFRPDGTLQYLRREKQRADGTFRLESEMAGCIADSRKKIEETAELSPAQTAYLELAVSEARAAGATVSLWLTGPHPRTAEHMAVGTAYPHLLAETWGLLRRIDSGAYNLHDPRAYGGPFQGYYDCNHFDDSHARIVERMLLGLDAEKAEPRGNTHASLQIAGGVR